MFKIDSALAADNNLWTYDNVTGQISFSYKDDIEKEYQSLFSNIFPSINTDPSTPQGQIITALTQKDMAVISYLENLANAFFFGGNGYFLDLWAWNLYRVARKEGIPSSVIITIQGIAGTRIPEGFTVTDGEHKYKITGATTIAKNGTVDVLFNAETIDDFIANPNTITKTITTIQGVERVTNNARATKAVMRETDGELFQRCVFFGSTAKNASFRSIMANIAQLQGVSRVAGAENYGNTNKTIGGIELPPHSICLVIDGGDDKKIAQTIYESRATGCDMVGTTEVELLSYGQKYTYKFYRPSVVQLKASVRVSALKDQLIPSNFYDNTRQKLSEYISTLDINSTITQPALAKYLVSTLTDLNVNDVQFGLKDGNLSYASIQLKLNEIATMAIDDIDVIQEASEYAK